MSKSDTRIYIGNLPPDIRSKEIEDLFYKYGKIRFVDLKNRKGPPFAFVEYDDPRDAEDAVKGRDRYNYEGYKLRVEFQKGNKSGGGGMDRGRGPASGPPRRSDYRVLVSGLPPTGSWQDLKDHMRDAGQVCYSDVFKDGTGVVEFTHYDDMKYALKNLDDTKFRSHEGETSYIRLKADSSGGRSNRSRSVSRSRSRSRSRGGAGGRQSPSYSPARRASRSRSRSYDDSSRSKRSKHSRRASHSRSRSGSPAAKKRAGSSASRSRSRSPRRADSRSRSRSSGRDAHVAADEKHSPAAAVVAENGHQDDERQPEDE